MIRTKVQAIVVATGLLASLGPVPAFAQEGEHGKMGKTSDTKKMSGAKMSDDDMMAKMDSMSVDEKAAMVDKMAAKDKTDAMKMSGTDVSKMSAQEKADMFDKMPMEKKKAMVSGGSMAKKGGKMGTMGKTDKTDKMKDHN